MIYITIMSIKINVGGKIYETLKPTICKSGYFKNLLGDCTDLSEIIFVNRSSKLFDHVIAYLTDDQHPYPKKYTYELDFYLIKYDTIMSFKINVDGKIFETFKPTICKAGYFQNLLGDCVDPSEIIFVNRSSKLFDHVIAYLTDDLHPYPKKYAYELDFYLINYDKDKLYDDNHEIKSEINKIKNELNLLEHNVIQGIQTLEDNTSNESQKLNNKIDRIRERLEKINMGIRTSIQDKQICSRSGCDNECQTDYYICDDHCRRCSKVLDTSFDGELEFCDNDCSEYEMYCEYHTDS